MPSGAPRRRLSYGRDADTDVVVLGHHTNAEAPHLKTAMAQWRQEPLGLPPHPEKTHLTPWNDRVRFLGYDRRGQRHPNGTRWLRRSMPPEPARDVKAKVTRWWGHTQSPERDRFMSVNALLRGWTNDVRDANQATNRFRDLTGVVYWLTAHDLGRKQRGSITRLRRTRSGVDPASGTRAW